MRSSPLGNRFIGAALAVLLLAAMSALGQSTATLTGTVTDELGAVIPNAQVAAINQDTNLRRTTTTDATGNYQIPFLPSGTYRVEVEAPGLQHQVITDVTLNVSRTAAQNFKLKPATVEQAVTITGEMPIVERTTMTVGSVMPSCVPATAGRQISRYRSIFRPILRLPLRSISRQLTANRSPTWRP